MKTSDRHPNVLGLCSFTHDSAAALITGGQLTGMAEEERLSGVKHTREYPAAAVRVAAARGGPDRSRRRHRRLQLRRAPLPGRTRRHPRSPAAARNPPAGAAPRGQPRRHPPPLPAADEHPARPVPERDGCAASRITRRTACTPSPRPGSTDAAVLIIDSLGETCTTSIGSATCSSGGGVRYRISETISDPASLGYAYGAVTAHLGWRRGDEEGTVMALAALGDPARFRGLLARAIPLTPDRVRARPRPVPAAGAPARLAARHPRVHRRRPARRAAPARRSPRSTRISRRRCRNAPSR